MSKLYIGSELILPETSDIVLKEDLSTKISGDGIGNVVSLSRSEYDALANKDTETIYVVETEIPTPAVLPAGTIVYYDGSQLKFSSPEVWDSSLGTPVAVVVVPNTHTPDGTVRCMAVTGVDRDGSQTNSEVTMAWGPMETETSLPYLTQVPTWDNTVSGTISSKSYAYLSSNKGFTGATDCLDNSLKYYNTSGPFFPNPYLADGSPNPDFRNTSIVTDNACADFNGADNTSVLVGLGSAYTAANACHLYSTSGISAGNWYLPACGELAYIMPRFNQIQNALSTVGGVQLYTGNTYYGYWSSREHSSRYQRYVNILNGAAGTVSKDNTNVFVRCFCSLPAPTSSSVNLYKGSAPINDTYSKSDIDEKIGDIESILATL